MIVINHFPFRKCLLFLSFIAFLHGSAYANEIRGMWVDAFRAGFWNSNQVSQLVQHCRKYNFNSIFVQMRRRGDAFYVPKPPNQEPRTTVLASDFDALAEVLRQAHQGKPRIEVHCWLTSYLVWADHTRPPQSNHIFNLHSDWLTQDPRGETRLANGFYLDPGHPDASQWLHDVAIDIASRYEIDGLHWDYFRYPTPDSGYNPVAVQRFRREFALADSPKPGDPRFAAWRQRQIADLLRWTTADLLSIKPELVVSAAVLANHGISTGYHFADWVKWADEGLLDLIVPMNFAADTPNVFEPRAAFALRNKGRRGVCIGLGAYLNTPDKTLEQLNLCRKAGQMGTVLFSYASPIVRQPERGPLGAGPETRIVDNLQGKVQGPWQKGRYGKLHGQDYHFIHGGNGDSFVQFQTNLPPAQYDVFEWHVAGSNRASDAVFEIHQDQGVQHVQVDQRRDGSKWNYLGRFSFASGSPAEVRVTDASRNSDQVVIADAIRFTRVLPGQAISERTVDSLQSDSSTYEEAEDPEQKAFWERLKTQFQPEWVNTPPLPWKTNFTILKGVVRDADSGKPIYNATVELPKSARRNQKTEPHGVYAFFDTSPGEHEVIVSADGFRSITNRVEVRPGMVTQSDFTLSRLEPILGE